MFKYFINKINDCIHEYIPIECLSDLNKKN